jgi:extracellular elastinolytic metalloproteinase
VPTMSQLLTVSALGGTVLAVGTLGTPGQAAIAGRADAVHSPGLVGARPATRAPGDIDTRQLTGRAAFRAVRTELGSRSSSDQHYLRSLGSQALISYDPLTGTPRNLGRRNGYLTGRSPAPARRVAMSYVHSHLSVLGLRSSDLRTLRFRGDYVDTIGVHHLSWSQSVRGVPVFGNGLEIMVTRDGHVLSVRGSPVSGLGRLAARAPSTWRVTATSARAAAARNVGGRAADVTVARSRGGAARVTTWANHDYAERVWFLTSRGLRPAWSTYVQSGPGASYQHVVDARTRSVLFRHSTVESSAGDAYVYDNYPGAAAGGTARVVNLIERGWLPTHARFLTGSSAVAFDDLNDDNQISRRERTPVPGDARGATFGLVRYGGSASGSCTSYVCTWNPGAVRSWEANRAADAAQAFYLASRFHDYLAKRPIGFTSAAGSFSTAGGDPVLVNALDGAATDGNGMPDAHHIDNANMSTPPDGVPPTMQLYLWHVPGTSDDPATGDPFVPTSSAFDASILYHEYTHGMSNRLVTTADGTSALNSFQSASMGEGWSDYYAMDYLVRHGLMKDTSKPGQLLEGAYVAAGLHSLRTMAIDCGPTSRSPGCTSGFDGSKGGYTYGALSTIIGRPEVHASGELWGQTLWDLRTALGHTVADTLITRAMSLSPADPSMLDMRDAILQADLVAYGRSHTHTIWRVFAQRGMGYFAGTTGGDDTDPAEDFSTPPTRHSQHFHLTGTVSDQTTGNPVVGAIVQIAGLGDRGTAVTDATGAYTFHRLAAGSYPKVVASAPGYLPEVESVTVPQSARESFRIERDWAAAGSGASVVDADGPDWSPQCGPGGAIDVSLGTGWGSVSGDHGEATNQFLPKSIVVDLKKPIDISSFGVDPNATCGDPGSSSTGDYSISTSTVGPNGPWTEVASGTFGAADRGRINRVDPKGGSTGVRWVELTIEGNQVPDFADTCPTGNFGGCTLTDLTELAVFGSPSS